SLQPVSLCRMALNRTFLCLGNIPPRSPRTQRLLNLGHGKSRSLQLILSFLGKIRQNPTDKISGALLVVFSGITIHHSITPDRLWGTTVPSLWHCTAAFVP